MQKQLYIDEAHTVLDIFRFAVFLLLQSIGPILSFEPFVRDFWQLSHFICKAILNFWISGILLCVSSISENKDYNIE